jgi:hypothetical protein
MDLVAFLVDRGSDDKLHYGNYVDDRFRYKSCCGQNLHELAQNTVLNFPKQLVVKVWENPFVEARLPSVDRCGFYWPPSPNGD